MKATLTLPAGTRNRKRKDIPYCQYYANQTQSTRQSHEVCSEIKKKEDALAVLIRIGNTRSSLLVNTTLIRIEIRHFIIVNLVRRRCIDPVVMGVIRRPLG